MEVYSNLKSIEQLFVTKIHNKMDNKPPMIKGLNLVTPPMVKFTNPKISNILTQTISNILLWNAIHII
ncbi:MAG: hypothetical protein ACK43K_10875, partial [Chitinophagales bacterium]